MAENNQDSALPVGTEGSPKPEGLEQESGQHGSGLDVAKLQTTLDALVKRQDEIDARTRALQGDKDRDVKKTRREVEEIKRMVSGVDKLRNAGLELEDAAEEFDFREAVRQLKEQLANQSQNSAKLAGNEPSSAETTEALKKYGFTGNEAEVLPALTLKGAEQRACLADLALSKANRSAPSPASAPALQSNVTLAVENREGLKKEYIKEMQEHRGDKTAINSIQAHFKQKGLDIENIGFGV